MSYKYILRALKHICITLPCGLGFKRALYFCRALMSRWELSGLKQDLKEPKQSDLGRQERKITPL